MNNEQKMFFYYFNKTKKLIDNGSFSTVYLFYNKRKLNTYAVKKVHKKHYPNLKNEIHILSYLKSISLIHKNNCHWNQRIVLLNSLFEDKDYYYLVFPYFEGSSLFSFFNKFYFTFTELEVFYFFYQMVSIVSNLHKNLVSHRDIKLENFVLNNHSDLHLYLIDFGFSEMWTSSTNSTTTIRSGSLYYAAPELLKKNTSTDMEGEKLDIWALGICLFVLLTGQYPFFSINDSDITIAQNIRQMTYIHFKQNTQLMSSELKTLLFESIFTLNPKKRFTCKQIKKSHWFTKLKPHIKLKEKYVNPFLFRRNYQSKYSKQSKYKKYNFSCPLLI